MAKITLLVLCITFNLMTSTALPNNKKCMDYFLNEIVIKNP